MFETRDKFGVNERKMDFGGNAILSHNRDVPHFMLKVPLTKMIHVKTKYLCIWYIHANYVLEYWSVFCSRRLGFFKKKRVKNVYC